MEYVFMVFMILSGFIIAIMFNAFRCHSCQKRQIGFIEDLEKKLTKILREGA